jgi:hypothetical protein
MKATTKKTAKKTTRKSNVTNLPTPAATLRMLAREMGELEFLEACGQAAVTLHRDDRSNPAMGEQILAVMAGRGLTHEYLVIACDHAKELAAVQAKRAPLRRITAEETRQLENELEEKWEGRCCGR